MNKRYWGSLALVLVALPAAAQQTGTLTGKVTGKNGQGIAGVRVDVTANVLPQPKRVLTNESGEYRLPFLPPGEYVLTYTHADKLPQKRSATVLLGQTSTANVVMADTSVAGASVEVVAEKATIVDATSTEIKSSFSSEVINALPVGQDYRDLVKLIPGVTYTQDAVRGPSAGGSGQDNIAQLDGVNVNLPLFGTMSATPSGHDIDQITILKGGADATGFNRSAGYTINSVSKSGTNAFTGELSYQILPDNLVAKRIGATAAFFEQEKTYAILNVGGPILQDKLFFFVSLYRPTVSQQNSANLYGTTPDLSSTRNEYFGKLTYAPTSNLLLHASYRDSDETTQHSGYNGSAFGPTTGAGAKGKLKIGILEGTWNVTPNSFINFKTTNFILKTSDHPDYLSPAQASFDANARLDVGALDTQGLFAVPKPRTGTTQPELDYNAFIGPIVSRYGFTGDSSGGGGFVGGASQINNQNFYRRNFEVAYDAVWGSSITHTFHAGVQWWKEMEDLYRVSNGWGSITVPYNTKVPTGLPNAGTLIYFQAAVQQQGILAVPTIHSEYVAVNYELNDKIGWKNFTFNVGIVISDDKLYGQGLSPDSTTLSGWTRARGNKYLEKEIKPSDTLQPRLGVTWNYHASDTVYANYARFVPAVSSLPRAASWDRNLAATVNVYFDRNGNVLARQTEASSTGKLFTPGMSPRHTDEFLIGTTRDFGKGLSGRFYGRYRKSVNFWEDTNNGARVMFNPPAGIPPTYYIPNLDLMLNQLQGVTNTNLKNTFVIAQLDDSFTKYYELGSEVEWKGNKTYINASYTWSHYYGNFDQDNSTSSSANDSNIFVGSSNIADDFGRQLWNNKYGNLSGDRRHKLKVFGTYELPWRARVGLYFIYQSGQPWQMSDYSYYAADRTAQGSTSTSDTNRYSEPAGSRTTPSHNQFDVTYTQIFWKSSRYRLEGMVDIYNLFNKQTGYNFQPSVHATFPGAPVSYYSPRRTQLGLRFLF